MKNQIKNAIKILIQLTNSINIFLELIGIHKNLYLHKTTFQLEIIFKQVHKSTIFLIPTFTLTQTFTSLIAFNTILNNLGWRGRRASQITAQTIFLVTAARAIRASSRSDPILFTANNSYDKSFLIRTKSKIIPIWRRKRFS